ncbi:MAG: tRNA (adenosine(37)-N6)-dimethylallyltransferase MiaA [Propionibacteriales bacterium]|nr:tRNA (adenosine(37)-N6)-dimethylallyltransferase MiaA [Propionibacteriales bacterium]
MSELPVLALNGPTASGKTAVAVGVAQALAADGIAAEVINADSMLVYRGMDIGTAKPTLAERGGVPHHLIDILEVTETASVADFQMRARERIADCRARGVVPILAGGSALYVHAIVDEFDFPPTDDAVRARLETELDERGAAPLYERLKELSPQVAAAIQPGNGRRIVRALEALEVTGEFRSELPQWRYALTNVQQFGLDVPRDILDARIDARVDQMWAAGLVAEVQALEAAGLREGRTASRAIGYRQVLAMFDGELTESEARAATAQGTRRLARKQLGWFRRDDRITWLASDEAAQRIASAVRARLLQADQEVGNAHDRVR